MNFKQYHTYIIGYSPSFNRGQPLSAIFFVIFLLLLIGVLSCQQYREITADRSLERNSAIQPAVEVEEVVYKPEAANNEADPMWCYGSTTLVRVGGVVFASGLETIKDFKPLNNVRWMLFKRDLKGWELQQVDKIDRTREPCPLAGFPDGKLFMSVNPTILKNPQEQEGPTYPGILQFDADNAMEAYLKIPIAWLGSPEFTEHSYRSLAADGPNNELIVFQNVGLTHSEWAFRDRDGRWAAQGKLVWRPSQELPSIAPYGATKDRANYANVVLKNRQVHFCGAAAYNTWERVQAENLTGRQWGNRWRRLLYTWSPDITKEPFKEWIEIASTQATGGWLFPGDLWVAPDGIVHILWTESPIHQGLRDKYFPDIRRISSIQYAQIQNGKVTFRRSLVQGGEGISPEIPGGIGGARFQVTPDNRLFVFYYVGGKDMTGKAISENRLMEVYPDGSCNIPVRVAMKHPLSKFFTNTTRGGSLPSKTLDLLGVRAGSENKISYAKVRLW